MAMMNSVTRKFVPCDINKEQLSVCTYLFVMCVCKYVLLLLAGGAIQMLF